MDMADLEMFYELVPVVAGTEAVAANVIHADTMLPAHKHTVGTVQIFHLVSYNYRKNPTNFTRTTKQPL